MEDVIFSGTQLRKPQGSAYVAITLDNSDHSLPIDYGEVTVARRVYRSGESEYLINGTVSRLKDVYSLFFDTGIGKEGYSIIGQGQIEKILNGKPEERRELFDEAAGIVKFKKNKAATEKALEAERDNLSRVNDILKELEKQVGPLKEQSETARKYLAFKSELKNLDVNAFLLEIEKLRADLERDQARLEIVNDDIEENRNLYEQTKEEYEQIENTIEQLNSVIDSSKNEIHEGRLAKERAEEAARKIWREQFDVASARAVAALPVLCEYCLPLVRVGGVFIAMKGPDADAELGGSAAALKKLGGAYGDTRAFTLPDGSERRLVVCKKISQTPTAYPRNGGKIAKKPL